MPLLFEESSISLSYHGIPLNIRCRHANSGGDLLLMIHGLGCSMECFDGLWEMGCFSRFSPLAFDLPGFGKSPPSDGLSCRMSEFAEISRLLIERFNAARLIIVGHSMGSAVGLLLAAVSRIPLLSFVSVEGNLFASDCTLSSSVTYDLAASDMARLALSMRHRAEKEHSRGMLLWSRLLGTADPIAFSRASRDLALTTKSGELMNSFRGLSCPKHYIYGDLNSDVLPLSLLEGAHLVKISESGHFPMVDNPEEFYSSLMRCISLS